MIRKGRISSVNVATNRARVTFQDDENTVTPEIPYASGLFPDVNDTAAVVFFSDNLADGLIIALF